MPDIDLQNIQTYHAAVVVRTLVANGLEHVIISPGSRSTPLTLAFAAHPRITSHVCIDERSAAFIALGIASASGKPAALVCTSGTAAANYFPAVAEAQKAGLPMLVLSADRDFNEMNTGANQWIDQLNLFGNKAVFFAQVKPRNNDPRDTSRLEYLAHQAWTESVQKGGCAHLNFPFRKPLEPTSDFLNDLSAFYQKNLGQTYRISSPEYDFTLDPAVYSLICRSTAPVVITTSGIRYPSTINLVRNFSAAGVPILAEAGSLGPDLSALSTYIDGANTFLRNLDTCSELTPDLIIRFGDEPVGKGLLNFLKVHQQVPVIRFSERLSWSNSTFAPEILVQIPKGARFSDLHHLYPPSNPSWLKTWVTHGDVITKRRIALLSEGLTLRDGDVYGVLSDSIEEGEILFVSNSFPARDIDSFGDKRLTSRKIFMNRGASGIDGLISTALGVSLVSSAPVTLLTGDLAFIHDLSAIVALKNLKSQLRVIVINNNGGGIFEMLPIADSSYFDPFFRTSQHIDAHALATAAGLASIKVTTNVQLKEALSSSQRYQLIECVTDQQASMMLRKALWD